MKPYTNPHNNPNLKPNLKPRSPEEMCVHPLHHSHLELTGLLCSDNYILVAAFCKLFDPVFRMEKEQADEYLASDGFHQLRASLFLEEYQEFLAALSKKDFFECIDALCDMVYILFGTFYLNNQSLYSVIARSRTFHAEKLPKQKHKVHLEAKHEHELKLLSQCYSQFVKELQLFNWGYETSVLFEKHTVFSETLDTVFKEVFMMVHASNMRKLDEFGKPIVNDGVIDPTRPVGKVLKPKNWVSHTAQAKAFVQGQLATLGLVLEKQEVKPKRPKKVSEDAN